MAEKSVNEMTAVEMVKAISAGETNCEEIVRANLFAIEAREDDVQAWVHVDAENAIASAKAMDAYMDDTLYADIRASYNASVTQSTKWLDMADRTFVRQRSRVLGL